MRFQILFSSLFIKIVAFAVNNDYKGHIFYVKLTESFCAQILVCDKLRFFDTFGKKGAGTADGSEVNTVIFFMASTTSGRRAPLPIIPRAPTDIMVGA